MPTLYAYKLTADRAVRRGPPGDTAPPCLAKAGDVLLFADPACRRFVACFPGHYSNCPTRRTRRVVINCVRHDLTWAAERTPPGVAARKRRKLTPVARG